VPTTADPSRDWYRYVVDDVEHQRRLRTHYIQGLPPYTMFDYNECRYRLHEYQSSMKNAASVGTGA
jgi:hypothetical protein